MLLRTELLSCNCINFCMTCPEDRGNHHHVNCEKYRAEKFEYLFYYEEGLDKWIPAPISTVGLIESSMLDVGEEREIKFKKLELTDKEYDNLTEA